MNYTKSSCNCCLLALPHTATMVNSWCKAPGPNENPVTMELHKTIRKGFVSISPCTHLLAKKLAYKSCLFRKPVVSYTKPLGSCSFSFAMHTHTPIDNLYHYAVFRPRQADTSRRRNVVYDVYITSYRNTCELATQNHCSVFAFAHHTPL